MEISDGLSDGNVRNILLEYWVTNIMASGGEVIPELSPE